MLRVGREKRSAAAWHALLDLVATFTTGLADFVLTRDELTRRESRRLRALRAFLEHDEVFRSLIRRLATDTELTVSDDAEVEAEVRRHAWRILLRALPEERLELYREGLTGHGRLFLFVTLEEAAQARQREAWSLLVEHWAGLLDGGLEPEQRRARALAVAEVFRQTRNFTGVQEEAGEPAPGSDAGRALRDGSEHLGPMLRLVLDDADPEVRTIAEQAVVDAGYALELERERQRRLLLELRDRLSASNQRVIELEGQIHRLGDEATAAQMRRAENGLEVQTLLRGRDLCVTRGWLDTADLTVDLEEVRSELQAALAAGQQALERLHQLRRAMQAEHQEARQVHATIQSLVRDQEHQESEIARLERQQAQAERDLTRARDAQAAAERQRSSLQSSPPAGPRNTGDEEQNRREQAAYRNRHDRWQRDIANLGRDIARLGSEIQTCDNRIRHCEQGIAAARQAWEQLQRRIDATRSRINEIRGRILQLEQRFGVQQRQCEEIRREIARLRVRLDEVERRMNEVRAHNRSELGDNTTALEHQRRELESQHEQLQQLSTQLNQVGDDHDRQRTRSQRLVQDIDGGRENYDRVSGEARTASATADASGSGRQQAHEREVLTDQEIQVHYTEGMGQAIERSDRPPSPTRRERRRRRRGRDRRRQT